MPVIVIGADTPVGAAVVAALRPASGEIRVFVTDPEAGQRYRNASKVAVGDLSDGTHVGGAALGAFCAICVFAAASDDRERHFAATPDAVVKQWADGLRDADIGRVIAIGTGSELPPSNPLARIAPEYRLVDITDRSTQDIAVEVAALEASSSL